MPPLARALPVVLLAVAVLLVFGQAIGFGFVVLDDPINITGNPFYQPLTPASLGRLLTVPYCGLYIPLTYTVWAALAAAGSLADPGPATVFDPRLYHAANLLLHFGCAWLVYRLALRLTTSPAAACLGALVFAVHPLQVESVCWVTETKGLLASFFSLAALVLLVAQIPATDSSAAPSDPPDATVARSRGYLVATLLFGLALLAKPSAVTLPLVALCILCFALRWPLRTALAAIWDWFLLAAVWVLVTRIAQPTADLFQVAPLWQRPFIAGDALAFYLRKLVWPVPLAIDYGRKPLAVMAHFWAYMAWLLPAFVALAAWLSRLPVVRAGAAVALVAPLPVLGLLPFQFQRFSTVADRYAYLSLVGVALVIAALLARFPRRALPLAIVAFAPLVVWLGHLSRQQSLHWRDSLALLTHSGQVNPDSLAVLVNLGVLYQQQNPPDLARAADCFTRALAIEPAAFEANTGQGTILLARGDYAGALAYFEKALAAQPLADRANAGAGDCHHHLGQLPQALEHLRLAARPDPRRTMPTLTLPERVKVLNALARILATSPDDQVRDAAEALTWAQQAVDLAARRNAPTLDTLAAAYAAAGQFDQAIATARYAVALARAQGKSAVAERIERHLAGYTQHQPLRETPAEQLIW